jgi:hypothetical protein
MGPGLPGAWGYDTRDPFGGERAPAGPRYERNGSTRPTWDRPVAWAGLDKVPPNRTAELVALQRRAAEIEAQLATTNERLHEEIDQLRSLYEGGRVLAAEGQPPQVPPSLRSRRPSRQHDRRWRACMGSNER